MRLSAPNVTNQPPSGTRGSVAFVCWTWSSFSVLCLRLSNEPPDNKWRQQGQSQAYRDELDRVTYRPTFPSGPAHRSSGCTDDECKRGKAHSPPATNPDTRAITSDITGVERGQKAHNDKGAGAGSPSRQTGNHHETDSSASRDGIWRLVVHLLSSNLCPVDVEVGSHGPGQGPRTTAAPTAGVDVTCAALHPPSPRRKLELQGWRHKVKRRAEA